MMGIYLLCAITWNSRIYWCTPTTLYTLLFLVSNCHCMRILKLWICFFTIHFQVCVCVCSCLPNLFALIAKAFDKLLSGGHSFLEKLVQFFVERERPWEEGIEGEGFSIIKLSRCRMIYAKWCLQNLVTITKIIITFGIWIGFEMRGVITRCFLAFLLDVHPYKWVCVFLCVRVCGMEGAGW